MQIQKIPLWSVDVHKIHIKEWALVKDRLLSIIPWDELNQRKNKFARETLRDEEHEMTGLITFFKEQIILMDMKLIILELIFKHL